MVAAWLCWCGAVLEARRASDRYIALSLLPTPPIHRYIALSLAAANTSHPSIHRSLSRCCQHLPSIDTSLSLSRCCQHLPSIDTSLSLAAANTSHPLIHRSLAAANTSTLHKLARCAAMSSLLASSTAGANFSASTASVAELDKAEEVPSIVRLGASIVHLAPAHTRLAVCTGTARGRRADSLDALERRRSHQRARGPRAPVRHLPAPVACTWPRANEPARDSVPDRAPLRWHRASPRPSHTPSTPRTSTRPCTTTATRRVVMRTWRP